MRGCRSAGVDASFSGNRVSGRKEPSFVLSLGQHDSDGVVRAHVSRPAEQFGREIFGTILLGIQQDQDALARFCLAGRKFNRTLELASFQYLLALYSNRPGNIHSGAEVRSDATKKDRKSCDLPVAFDDGRNPGHRSEPVAEEVNLVRREIR